MNKNIRIYVQTELILSERILRTNTTKILVVFEDFQVKIQGFICHQLF